MQQGSEEWLKFRKTRIMASDAPVIMGVSPYKDMGKLWLEKRDILNDSCPSYVMKKGKEFEVIALSEFHNMTGIYTTPLVITCPDLKWMGASLDGISLERDIIVEIKYNNKLCHEMAKSGIVPEHHYPQLQHQLAVVNLNKAYYFSYNGFEGILVEVLKDEDYIKKMIEKEFEFWQSLDLDIELLEGVA